MLSAYVALFHFFMLKALHIITPDAVDRQMLQYKALSKVKPGTHITKLWREESQVKQWTVAEIEPRRLSYNFFNILSTEPPKCQWVEC